MNLLHWNIGCCADKLAALGHSIVGWLDTLPDEVKIDFCF